MGTRQRWDRHPLPILRRATEEWLMRNFPPAYPVRVRYVPKIEEEGEDCIGLCERVGRRFEILVRDRMNRREMIETLAHEWAHAYVWRHAVVERRGRERSGIYHDDEYWLAFGRIYRKLYDEGGREEIDESIRR